jgi:mono/diheme cytochrome c family protein
MRFNCLVPPFALLLLASCASPPAPSSEIAADPGIAHGHSLAVRYCASCHAVDRADHSRHAGAPPFRTLSRLYPVDTLAEALVEGLMTGHADMPEYQFTPESADDFIRYLESIQSN